MAALEKAAFTGDDLEGLARATWAGSKEDFHYSKAQRDERGRAVKRDLGGGRSETVTEQLSKRRMPKWACPHCNQESRPAYAGYVLWAGGDNAEDGPGLYMTVNAKCYWSQVAIVNINALSPKGKHMKAWRPHHATMQACGELYAFETVKVLDF